ncbi:MAG: protein kinase [Pseudomonadota bacterium]
MASFLTQLAAAGNWLADQAHLAAGVPLRPWVALLLIPAASVFAGLGVTLWLWLVGRGRKTPAERAQYAEILFRRGRVDLAKEEFVAAGAFVRAAQIARRMSRFEEAVELALKGRDFSYAAHLLAEQGKHAEAAHTFARGGRQKEAAEQWERAGQLDRALECYGASGHGRKVQELLGRLGRWVELGRALTEELTALRGQSASNPTLAEQEQAGLLTQRAAEAFRKGGDLGEAYEVFLRAGRTLEAAGCLEEMGDVERAADLYRTAGNTSESARVLLAAGKFERVIEIYNEMDRIEEIPNVLRMAGKAKEGNAMEARLQLAKGERARAARLFEEAEEWSEAAQVLEEGENASLSAPLWEKAGETERAACAYERGGNLEKAAALYSEAGRRLEAGKCHERLGNLDRAEREYVEGGAFYHAGRLAESRESIDSAIVHFQRVPPDSGDEWNANHALARLFWRKGLAGLAQEKFDLVLKGAEIARENLKAFFDYAVFLEGIGKLHEAASLYEKILVVDFHFEDALERKKGVEERLRAVKEPGVGGEIPESAKNVRGIQGPIAGPRIGEVFAGRYEVESEIGGGGMGIVYAALDRRLGRKVALKVLIPRALDSKAEEERFLHEARVAAKLSHRHIVAFYDAGKQSDRLYLVMEFVEGPNLLELIRSQGPLPVPKTVAFLVQLADALAFAHERKIVHRDIKSANVLISKEHNVKVADFGLARFLTNAQITATRKIGSPLYMAPELIVGDKYDHRVDLYSLGVVAYEMLTGKPPFTEGEVLYHHVNAEPEPISRKRSGVPTVLEALVLKLLEKRPSDRPSSAAEVKAELEPLATALSLKRT